METFAAPAKLNLMLRVVGRRADGYHLLQTVFRFLDFGDDVALGIRADGVIRRVNDLPDVTEDDDLTIRAARLLQRATATQLGAEIALTKRLPLGGGLGGGSSDAATVLVALNHLWSTGLSRRELQALALQLGADVPVFVFGQSAFAEGVGEKLAPMALPPAWYVVLTPPVTVATARIFSDPALKRDSEVIKMHGFSVATATNDLEPLVCRLYPEVAHHLKWLKHFEQQARMTGSGACVFAAFESEQAARFVLARMPEAMRGFVARGIDRHPLHDLVAE